MGTGVRDGREKWERKKRQEEGDDRMELKLMKESKSKLATMEMDYLFMKKQPEIETKEN